jgi:hypothetical protein
MKKDFYIFLDFDGVLHPPGKKTFEKMPLLAKELLKYPHLKIIFSTSWRTFYPLKDLTYYMPKKIQHLCVNKTPILNHYKSYVRYEEILLFNQEKNISKNWLALDDTQSLFPKNCQNLLWISPKKQFSLEHIPQLHQKIQELSNFKN